MSPERIIVINTINADTKKVWEFWNQPEHITKWNFASEDWHCPKATNDLRSGGKLCYRMVAKDGSFGFDFEGVYNEVIPQEKIRYVLDDGRTVTTTFEALNKKTKVYTSFDADTENSLEKQRTGWQAILDNFKRYVESN